MCSEAPFYFSESFSLPPFQIDFESLASMLRVTQSHFEALAYDAIVTALASTNGKQYSDSLADEIMLAITENCVGKFLRINNDKARFIVSTFVGRVGDDVPIQHTGYLWNTETDYSLFVNLENSVMRCSVKAYILNE